MSILGGLSVAFAQSLPSNGPQLLAPETTGSVQFPQFPESGSLSGTSDNADDLPPFHTFAPQNADLRHNPIGNVPCETCPEYWVVSSRRCRIERPPETCSLDFFERGPQGTLIPRSRQDFLGTLSPEIPVCFVVHGSFVGWNSWLHESDRTCRWLRNSAPHAPIRFVFVTWPSDSRITYFLPADVAILGRRSAYHSLFLGELIRELPPQQPVSLIGHSHGARLAVSSLHLLGGGEVHGYRMPVDHTPRRLRAVLVAAAVDHHWLNPGERYSEALSQTEAILNIRNGTDIALVFYPLRKPFGYEALGQSGFQQQDHLQLGANSRKISELEVSPILQTAHLWPNYYRKPELATALAPYVYFQSSQQILGYRAMKPQVAIRHSHNWGQAGTDIIVPHRAEAHLDVVPGLNLNVNLLPRR